MVISNNFWKNKKVLITGHTGFKGSWLTIWLESMGAKIVGVSLDPLNEKNLYDLAKIGKKIKSLRCDIRNRDELKKIFSRSKPEIVFHLAAQPLVIKSYKNPVETYETNFMGTLNILESIRNISSVKACIVVTSDKCYQNNEWNWGYRENDPLGGHDPYSSSKGSCELLVNSYRLSYFTGKNKTKIASVRAGNVIGGGDFSDDRLIPDAVNSFVSKKILKIRSPKSTRPWQHVLEPLGGYILLAQKLISKNSHFDQAWNFGPYPEDIRTVRDVIDIFVKKWGKEFKYKIEKSKNIHEAKLLSLDCSKAIHEMKWRPNWNLEKAIEHTVNWYKAYLQKEDLYNITLIQINEYLNQIKE